MNTNTLPILNLLNFNIAEFEKGSNITKDRIKEELKKCCKEHGFFTISGHGVSDKVKEDAINVTRKFFKLPQELKIKYCKKYEFLNQQRGYQEKEFSKVNPLLDSAPTDINEIYVIGSTLSPQQKDNMTEDEKREDYAENIWPLEFPEMKKVMTLYHEEMYSLSIRIHKMMEYIFDFRIPKYSSVSSHLYMNYYPRIKHKMLENQWRVAHHEDYDLFTILLPEPQEGKVMQQEEKNRGGLEILNKEYGWCRAVYDKSLFVINCGSTLQEASKGQCKSPFHRVSMPEANQEYDNSRISLAYFCFAEYEANKSTVLKYQDLQQKGDAVLKE
jgi:isopenicillin N synthase-like dioxygenase